MTDRVVDVEFLEKIGREDLSTIADIYDRALEASRSTDRGMEQALAIADGSMPDSAEYWLQTYALLNNVLYESAFGYSKLSSAIVKAAEDSKITEEEIVKNLESSYDSGLNESYTRVDDNSDFEHGSDEFLEYDAELAPEREQGTPYEEGTGATGPGGSAIR
ncbi:hypothetical protein [Salininema proteolyticum]|uniref:Uncharacterized protein n=1 Tax=Salininema proteolyticum TaxID=1607685 RepID=A0ABV8TVX0_9ACTN